MLEGQARAPHRRSGEAELYSGLGVSGIVLRPEQAILREEIARLTVENMELRKTIVLDRRDSDARDARIASLAAMNA